MIPYTTREAAISAGYHLDILGRPIQQGDRILTKGYGTSTMSELAIVKRITPKAIIVDIHHRYYNWGKFDSVTRSYPDKQLITKIKEMRRKGSNCLVVGDLYGQSTALYEAFINDHPELFV